MRSFILPKHENIVDKFVKFLNGIKQRWVAEQKVLKLKQIKKKLKREKKQLIRSEASQTV